MKFDFENNIKRLKDITENMENSDLELEKSLELYTEGIKLYKKCSDFLEKTTRKVEILKNGKDVLKEDVKPKLGLIDDVE